MVLCRYGTKTILLAPTKIAATPVPIHSLHGNLSSPECFRETARDGRGCHYDQQQEQCDQYIYRHQLRGIPGSLRFITHSPSRLLTSHPTVHASSTLIIRKIGPSAPTSGLTEEFLEGNPRSCRAIPDHWTSELGGWDLTFRAGGSSLRRVQTSLHKSTPRTVVSPLLGSANTE